MTALQLIPAHDPRVMVHIDIPIEGRKKPLTFSVKRWEFQPSDRIDEYQAHLNSIFTESGELEQGRSGEMMIDWWIDNLPDIADADRKTLRALTAGERAQLWELWRDASKVDLGESEAS